MPEGRAWERSACRASNQRWMQERCAGHEELLHQIPEYATATVMPWFQRAVGEQAKRQAAQATEKCHENSGILRPMCASCSKATGAYHWMPMANTCWLTSATTVTMGSTKRATAAVQQGILIGCEWQAHVGPQVCPQCCWKLRCCTSDISGCAPKMPTDADAALKSESGITSA